MEGGGKRACKRKRLQCSQIFTNDGSRCTRLKMPFRRYRLLLEHTWFKELGVLEVGGVTPNAGWGFYQAETTA